MQAKEAAAHLGITQRMLRHYEKEGLLDVDRRANGYRHYGAAELRRAARIRDFIAIGFSTREVRAMAACLADENAGPCEGGIEKMLEKLAHIESLQADLEAKRALVQERLGQLQHGLNVQNVVPLKTGTGR